MTSISTNYTAQSALSLLRAGYGAQEKISENISSGKSVNSADDNAAYWAISQMMNAQNVSLGTTQDAIGFSQAITDTASMGLSAATDIVSQIRSKLILASATSGSGRDAVNQEITQLKNQLKTVADASGFSGENWLKLGAGEAPGTKSLLASVIEIDAGTEVNTIDYDTTGTVLVSENDAADGLLTAGHTVTTESGTSYTFHLLDAGSTTAAAGSTEISVSDATTGDEFEGMIATMDDILAGITDAGAKMGATRSNLSAQDNFLADLSDAITRGIGKLVDSDLEEEAASFKASQVQTQLQSMMLNISNANARSLSQLFM